jgi:hypothetical protein
MADQYTAVMQALLSRLILGCLSLAEKMEVAAVTPARSMSNSSVSDCAAITASLASTDEVVSVNAAVQLSHPVAVDSIDPACVYCTSL